MQGEDKKTAPSLRLLQQFQVKEKIVFVIIDFLFYLLFFQLFELENINNFILFDRILKISRYRRKISFPTK
jgi:hypothetical protein